jgi:predicted ATPase
MDDTPFSSVVELTRAGLSKFKAFGEPQDFEIKPITLLYGYNSCGKSSFLHSLLYLDEIARSENLDVHKTTLGQQFVDLGGFEQFVYRKNKEDDKGPCEFTLKFDNVDELGNLKLTLKVGKGTIGERLHLESVVVEVDGREMYSMKVDVESLVARQENKHSYELNIFSEESIEDDDLEALPEDGPTNPWNIILSDCVGRSEGVTLGEANDLLEIISKHACIDSDGGLFPDQVTFTPIEDLSTEEADFCTNHLVPALEAQFQKVSKQFKDFFGSGTIKYLGPLRSIPDRNSLAWSKASDLNWQSGGAAHWEKIKEDKAIRDDVNKWLKELFGAQYEFKVKPYLAPELGTITAASAVEKLFADRDFAKKHTADDLNLEVLLEDLKKRCDDEFNILADSFEKESRRLIEAKLVLVDTFGDVPIEVGPKDIGVGVSQVVPLIAIAVSSEDSIIMVEQPEVHLHPKQQAKLAELCIYGAMGERNNKFILETHSEFFLNKLMRKVGRTGTGNPEKNPTDDMLLEITPDDVGIYYVRRSKPVQEEEEQSKAEKMDLNKDGALKKSWPEGFFGELAEDILWYA